MIRSTWKPFYLSLNLYKKKDFFLSNNITDIDIQKNIFFAKRSDTILNVFVSKYFKIHNGNSIKILLIKPFMVNHKFGEFFLTRKRAIFKPKLKKKK